MKIVIELQENVSLPHAIDIKEELLDILNQHGMEPPTNVFKEIKVVDEEGTEWREVK
jgi:hypothetical protein